VTSDLSVTGPCTWEWKLYMYIRVCYAIYYVCGTTLGMGIPRPAKCSELHGRRETFAAGMTETKFSQSPTQTQSHRYLVLSMTFEDLPRGLISQPRQHVWSFFKDRDYTVIVSRNTDVLLEQVNTKGLHIFFW
jgi:hypothetical protein